MASSFSVTNNHYLRVIYMGNTEVTKKGDRGNFSSGKLTQADSTALRKGLARIADLDLDSIKDDDEDKKTNLFNTMKAFQDAYNFSIESGSASQNKSISALTKQMKKVSSEHADKLSDYGITFDDKGYMNIKNSAINNISSSKYKEIIGKDSDYAKELSDIAKKISKHVDIAV
ncbi:MAG: hypothetical protein IJ679_04880 [Lachnospiraceae bacterium]|nr:hypothetical protein [Lachnospiraceae bacterium]